MSDKHASDKEEEKKPEPVRPGPGRRQKVDDKISGIVAELLGKDE